MAKGRKTGGRKKGTPNKATAARATRAEKAAADGITPLEYMLKVLRNKNSKVEDKRWAAATAAPYIHPRLQATTFSGAEDKPPIQIVVNYPDEARNALTALHSASEAHSGKGNGHAAQGNGSDRSGVS